MAFVSLSIDLVGSTLAKQGIVTAAGDDMDKRNRYYREYLKLLFSIEREFYINVNQSFENAGLSMSRVSLVKSIGDEYWFAVDVDGDDDTDIATVAWSMIESSMVSIGADRYLGIPTEDEDSLDDETKAILKTNFPIKVLVDIINDPTEITTLRYQYLKDIFSILRQDSTTVFRVDDAFLALCNRLNIGGSAVKASGESLVARYDYIGLEIDRFFRLAKMARPSILAIGDNLAQHLDCTVQAHSEDLSDIGVKQMHIAPPAHIADAAMPIEALVIQEAVPAEDMKGIGEGYVLHHLFTPENLEPATFGQVHSALTLLAPSFSFLAENGYFLLNRDKGII
ncbi:hypothetical protein ACFL12_03710 [Pseudomonadota bacterium]